MKDNRKAPTPALPRKREKEHTPLLSSLSRLRGRVAHSSERDGWGQPPSESRAAI